MNLTNKYKNTFKFISTKFLKKFSNIIKKMTFLSCFELKKKLTNEINQVFKITLR